MARGDRDECRPSRHAGNVRLRTFLSLEQAFQRGRLGRCHGERPWLGDRDPAGYDLFLRLLTRTATNTYYSQVAAVISLPSAEDVLSALVQGHFSDLNEAQSPAVSVSRSAR